MKKAIGVSSVSNEMLLYENESIVRTACAFVAAVFIANLLSVPFQNIGRYDRVRHLGRADNTVNEKSHCRLEVSTKTALTKPTAKRSHPDPPCNFSQSYEWLCRVASAESKQVSAGCTYSADTLGG
jgi:hypothetical protein